MTTGAAPDVSRPLVLVTGSTGHLGRDIVARLLRDGHRVRVFVRSPQPSAATEVAVGDLATGEGLQAALRGVHTVINAATYSPIARRGGIRPRDLFSSPSAVDVEGTERLLASSREASVQHFVHVSIVGLEGAWLPYAKVKLAGEMLVRSSAIPWSVVRAAPFFYLLENMLSGIARLPIWTVPTTAFNPVDTSDVANHLATCAFDDGRGERAEIGGPDFLSGVEFARQYRRARGLHRAILPLPFSEAVGRGMGFVSTRGARGTLSWADWLERRFARSSNSRDA